MTALSDLIAKLEAAPEGSRELDAAIAVATFSEPYGDDDLIYARQVDKDDDCAAGTFWRKSRSGASLRTAPYFTTSLDAALPSENIVRVERVYGAVVHEWRAWTVLEGEPHEGLGHTEALARRIAALKARKAQP